ncbi:MAG: GH92 family glycosyl hydrolase [Clostridia bacterium]|nr:GH92 family glycosyl hydrolase [Clostridia bacterium]
MLRIFRFILSIIIAFELLFAALFAGGEVRVAMPEPAAEGNAKYVNAFVGTGGIPWMCGMLSPAAQVPFGAVRLGPDTSAVGGIAKVKTNTSGYYYEHRHIRGFSLSRLSGTGARDYGMFRVTPAVGKSLSAKAGALAYSHHSETAEPGYYAVYLPGAAALCEMTATAHAGVQRYTFTTKKDAKLYLDAASCVSEGGSADASVEVDPEGRSLTAYVTMTGTFSDRYGGLPVYLYAEWDADTVGVTAHTAEGDVPGGTSAAGEEAGVLLDFGSRKNEPVTLRAAISFVSFENAKENLAAEVGDNDFDAVRASAAADWTDRLSSININADDGTKEIYYTALYHAMLMPTDFTDANGEYRGFDGETHTADGFTYRTDISLWDTCRNVHALYTLIAPEIQTDCLESLLLMADQGGTLPRWPMGSGYTGSMFGNPANIVFTESYLKGLSFDAEKALDYMKAAAETEFEGKDSRDDAALYNEYGYLPDDLVERYSVSKTLEYAWEDAATAALAEALGDEDAAALYASRAENYKNLWDDETKYFRPRNSDGSFAAMYPNLVSFIDDVLGTKIFRAYCEGSARQWRWSAIHDVDGMIALFGSKEYFVSELEQFMKDASLTRAAVDPGSGYWIGNQHDMHAAYLFDDAGRADLTQKWVRWTLENRFSTDPDGLDGNDDGGTLSSWYVFSALGFYPIAGTDRYWIGSPCVDSAEIALPGGKTLKITANNQSDKNIYVSSVKLGGETLDAPYLTHAQIAGGGELVFEMAETAS